MSIIYRGDRIVTTAGIARENGRFFLARREAGGAQSRRWEFPGGKCDEGDSDEPSCLMREFQEELGVSVRVGNEIGSVTFEHKRVLYILVAYEIELVQSPKNLTVHTETGWFLPEELLALDLADSDRVLIERHILPGR